MKKYIYITLFSLLAFLCKAGGQSLHGRISGNDTIPLEDTLDAVFVTPEDDMALMILGNVWEKALANRKALKGYEADIVQNFVAKDADIIPKLMPSSIMFLVKSYVKLHNRGAIMKYVLDNRSVEVEISTHICNSGWKRNSYSTQKVLASNPTMNSKAQKQLFRMLEMDLFNEVYNSYEAYGNKGRKDYIFSVLGNIDYNGKTVYILEAKPKDADSKFISTKHIYVVDGDWGILRVESKAEMFSRTMECRDIGGGIYMPVSLVEQPAKISFNKLYGQAKQAIDSLEEKPGRMVRNVMKKAARLNESGRQITPYVTHEFRITYSNVKL